MDNPTPAFLSVLIAEDSEADTELLLRELRRAGYDPAWERVETADAMRAALDRQEWDIVISDFTMPWFNGMEALRLLQQRKLDIPFIIVSGTVGEQRAVEIMRAGAHDYIVKGDTVRLVPAIERALKEAEARRNDRRGQERVQHLAYYDPLTGLPNRTLFADRLQQAVLVGRRKKQHFALMTMDLDHFKEANDTHGHSAGDRVLQQVATRLKTCLRESDTLARMGGDDKQLSLPQILHWKLSVPGDGLLGEVSCVPFAASEGVASNAFNTGVSPTRLDINFSVVISPLMMDCSRTRLQLIAPPLLRWHTFDLKNILSLRFLRLIYLYDWPSGLG